MKVRIYCFKNVWTCCEGYRKVVGELRCVPICKESCGNGTCVNPEMCRCDKGYQNVNNEIDKRYLWDLFYLHFLLT